MLPPLAVVARLRPVALVGQEADVATVGAPYVAVEAAVTGPARLQLTSGTTRLAAHWDGERCELLVGTGTRTTRHRSRRDGRAPHRVEALGVSLTGRHLSVLTRHAGIWTVRGRVDLGARVDTRDETWLAGLRAEASGAVERVRRGAFGQLGLRDLRVVTHADGTAYREGAQVLLTATSAGPGFFDTAHTSVWSLDPAALTLRHRSDLFFRRPGRTGVFGDHATHLVRAGGRWLVATSTWGDFDPRARGASVRVTLAETTADLLGGRHVLDTRGLPLPTTGLRSVGVWDPHLVRTADGWLVAYVNATRFFRFHPVLATGPDLDHLVLRGHSDRVATEGPTLLRLDGTWRLAASDGRDGRAGQRRAYPVFDLDLRQVGALSAAYPTNIPWPTLVEVVPGAGDWRMVGFDATPYGGRLVGYGSHGDVVVQAPGAGPGAGLGTGRDGRRGGSPFWNHSRKPGFLSAVPRRRSSRRPHMTQIIEPDTHVARPPFQASERLASHLQQLSVDLIDLHVQGKQAHWNVVGLNFRDLHLALDEVVDAARIFSDTVAERMRAVYVTPDGRARTVAEQSSLPEYPTGEVNTADTVDLITQALYATCGTARRIHDEVDAEDPTTADIIHAILERLEQLAWMIDAENRVANRSLPRPLHR